MLSETIKFWWSENSKVPLALGAGVVFASLIAVVIYYHAPSAKVTAEVISVFYQHKGNPQNTVAVRLSNGTTSTVGPIQKHLEKGDMLCLQKGKNVLGLTQHRLLHVGKCT